MRNLILATTLIVAPALALAAGPSCAVLPSIRAAQTTIDNSVPVPLNPQAQAARAAPPMAVQQPSPGPATALLAC